MVRMEKTGAQFLSPAVRPRDMVALVVWGAQAAAAREVESGAQAEQVELAELVQQRLESQIGVTLLHSTLIREIAEKPAVPAPMRGQWEQFIASDRSA